LNKKRGNKIYYKYVVVIPEEKVKEAGFKEGDSLEAEAKKGEIRLKRK
jgi:bifunctional DNA-binding transcriptional regulator/antitoxin component of YhaV-PrlF toxin-antitoxin module